MLGVRCVFGYPIREVPHMPGRTELATTSRNPKERHDRVVWQPGHRATVRAMLAPLAYEFLRSSGRG
jgi:hypothetical protein